MKTLRRTHAFGVGDRVKLMSSRDLREACTVTEVHQDGTYRLESDDGYMFKAEERELVRVD